MIPVPDLSISGGGLMLAGLGPPPDGSCASCERVPGPGTGGIPWVSTTAAWGFAMGFLGPPLRVRYRGGPWGLRCGLMGLGSLLWVPPNSRGRHITAGIGNNSNAAKPTFLKALL
jgi:hypothetical protein